MRWYKNAQNTWIGNKYAINMRICQNCTYRKLVVMRMGNILPWHGTKTHKILELCNKYAINMRICQNCTYRKLVVNGEHLTMRWYKNTQNIWTGNKYTINMRICQNCTYRKLVVMQMGNILLWDGTKTHKILELVTNTR